MYIYRFVNHHLNQFQNDPFVIISPENDRVSGTDSDVYSFSASSHAHSLLASVHTLREHNGLCDVSLSAEGATPIPAHRVILAAGSPYFNAMFTNIHRESFASRINLNSIDSSTLRVLVDFIYSSSLEITEGNVQNLLAGASLLQLSSVVEACCRFLRARVCTENCLGISAFADQHGCSELHRFAWRFAAENFAEVVGVEEFLASPTSLLVELLKSEDLQVKSEEEVLDCVLLWLRHDERGRSLVVMEALEHVKLPLVPWKYLSEKFNQSQPLAVNPICRSYVECAKLHQIHQNPPHSLNSQKSTVFTPAQYLPRNSVGQNMFIYAVGGETSPGRTTVDSVERFNPTKNEWQRMVPMTMCRRGVGVAMLSGYLYTVGGSDGLQALKLAERYDPACDLWTQISDMNEKRSSVAAAALGDYFYAVGGYTGVTSCRQSVERYNPGADEWSYVASTNVPRSMACACSMEGKLYTIGGYDGVSDLQTCEVFDPETNEWRLIHGMRTRRCMAGVAAVDGLLYVAGGCDHSVSLKSVESYDPSSGEWTVLGDMSEARSGLGMAVIGHKLFAMGGHNGRGSGGYCSSVEQYNIETNVWAVVTDMTAGRRRFGCCS